MYKPYSTWFLKELRAGRIHLYPHRQARDEGRSIAIFWIEDHIGVDHVAAYANARLFMLAHKMLELLEDLLPELILEEAGEQAHVDIGRIENMLEWIASVGPYTRDLIHDRRENSRRIYKKECDANEANYIAKFYKYTGSYPSEWVDSNKATMNSRLFLFAPSLVDTCEALLSGGALECNVESVKETLRIFHDLSI